MMALGRETSQWNQTSHVLAWIQNWSGNTEEAVDPRRLNPMLLDEQRPAETEIGADDLAMMICGQAAVDAFKR